MNIDTIGGVKVSMAFNRQGQPLGSVAFVGQHIERSSASRDISISSSEGNSVSLELADLIAGRQCSYYQGPIIHEQISQAEEGIYFSNSKGDVIHKIPFENKQDYTTFLDQLTEGQFVNTQC